MALTDTAVKNAKPDPAKPRGYKLTDSQGLHLLVKAAGKYWGQSYRFAGKQKTLALGVYPAISLSAARKARDAARSLLAQGIDPALQKRIDKATAKTAAANTFEATAREFHQIQAPSWSESYAQKWLSAIAFNADAVNHLLALNTGDSIAATGPITPKVWTDNEGNTRPALDMTVHAILTAYQVKRKRQAAQHQDDQHGQEHRPRDEAWRAGSQRQHQRQHDEPPPFDGYDDMPI